MPTQDLSQPPQSIFLKDGEEFVPTGLAQGPWYPDSVHGSAMIALLARAIERHPADAPCQVVRLTVDMMRAAPKEPLRTTARVHRGGKSVEFVEASLWSGDEQFARATAMRFRLRDFDVPEDDPGRAGAPPLSVPEASEMPGWQGGGPEAFHQSLELRPVPGFETPTMWLRFLKPLVEGEENTPLVRVAVAADFTYSVPFVRRVSADPSLLEESGFVSINPDTSFNLHRPPEGEWICLDARALYSGMGAGTAVAHLFDERGPIGHASQSLLVRGADQAPKAVSD